MKLTIKTSFKPNDELTIPVTCSDCGHTSDELVVELEKTDSCICRGCGIKIEVGGDGWQAIKAARQLDT